MRPDEKMKTIFSAQSAFNNIAVVEDGFRRSLKFNESTQASKPIDTTIQSFNRMQSAFGQAWILQPSIKSVLEIGLGVGNVSNSIIKNHTNTEIDIVEIDPAVLKAAEEFFGFDRNRPGVNVYVEDGRTYLEKNIKLYDAIFIDAFISADRSAFIPFSLVTSEFFSLVRTRLNSNGMVVIHNIDRNKSNLTLLNQQIAQGMSLSFSYVFILNVGESHSYIFGCTSLPVFMPEEFEAFQVSAKSLVLTDAVAPENKVLMPYWVRDWNEKALLRTNRLQKLTQQQAIDLSFVRVKTFLKPWLQKLEGQSGLGQEVYLLDSGIGVHQEFSKKQSEESISDRIGHGTHLASIICGKNIGIAPESELHAINVFQDQNKIEINYLIQVLEKVIESKPKNKRAILNASFCTSKSAALDEVFDRLIENNFVCIVGAGNHGSEDKDYSPASHPGVVSVAALDSLNRKLKESNFGGNVAINVLAQNIIGAHHRDPEAYVWMHGTSVASAIVSGVAALYFQKFPNDTVQQFKTFLQN